MLGRSTVRIFISSPSDVRPERLKAEQIVARLDREFAYHFHVEAVLWEREPLVATHHFQDPQNIPPPRGCDVVVVILWSQLGVMLPADKFRGAVSGHYPVTGTEWEFEDALAGAREHGTPDLLLYRKTAPVTASLDDEAILEERRAQRILVQEFISHWFRAEDGPGYTAASHSFAETAIFEEQLYDHLHALLERRAGAAAEGIAIRWHEAPYRGLLSFDYEQAPVFFGRTRARNELRELLAAQIARGTAFVLVLGASGSGKSSLVKAGLLPDLALPGMIERVGLVRRGLMRPSEMGGDPVAALAGAILSPTALPELAGLQWTPEGLSALLREAPGQAALPIRQGLAEAGKAAGLIGIAEARLIVVIDQLEELFTIDGLGEQDRTAFVAALATLAKSSIVWVVATMRSDFFDKLETLPALAALSWEGRFLLLHPSEPEISQIIRLPALEAGLRFEHDARSGTSLDEVIREAAARDRGGLPLLSFLLDQLWQRCADTGVLTFNAYRELGGLEGAIGRRAEVVFQGQPAVVQQEFVFLLRELVSIEDGKPVSRTVPLSRFAEGSSRRALVDALRHPDTRLLVNFDPTAEPGADEARRQGGGAQLRLAHEALLTHWPRAKAQIEADTRDLELRDRLEEAARRWLAAGRRDKRRWVIAGLPLAEARVLLARWGAELPALVRDFITASRRVARWRRVQRAATIAAAPVGAVLIAFLVWATAVWLGVRRVEAEWAAEHAFVRIPDGCFAMGSPDSDAERFVNEGPVHRVCVNSFDLGKYDVTQWEWRQIMIFPNNSDPSHFKGDRRPVEQVAWNDAWWFVHLMSWFSGVKFRLPSEAEWEYAARAGTTSPYFWGEQVKDGCAYAKMADAPYKELVRGALTVNCNYQDVFGTEPVGSLKPNAWGLFDMLGNVYQMVEDCYTFSYKDAPTDGSPVATKDCTYRVIRGGSWYSEPRELRSGRRTGNAPEARANLVGFRVVRTTTP